MPALRILDDRERELVFASPPRRVVSLVPSDTDSLFALGAGDRLVGRTRFCVAPEGEVDRIPALGGPKDPDVEAIVALAPDLVIANQEENSRTPLGALITRGVPVFISFPRTVAQGVGHVARLAKMLGLLGDDRARAAIALGYSALRQAEALLEADALAGRAPLSAFVPVWDSPLITGTAETYLSDALRLAGARNVFADRKRRYPLAADLGLAPDLPAEQAGDRDTRWPRVAEGELVARAPEVVLLPDEPYAFSEADAARFRAKDLPAARSGRVARCNGKDLTWHGAWSAEALPRLRALVDSLRGARA